MKFKFIPILLLLITYSSFSQESMSKNDSLINAYISIKTSVETDGYVKGEKCGFGIVNSVKSRMGEFTDAQKKLLKPYIGRPVKSITKITPSGKFKVHYNETDSVKYDLNLFMQALDSAYNYEVNFLGFPPPPADNNMGGDNLYDIYISDIGGNGTGYYGYTEFEDYLPGGKQTSYIVVDNDYKGFYTEGIDGARVTAAHEFHHAIQVGNYYYRESDRYFYELTSTAMEEFVFDSVNDFVDYLDNYFNYPNKKISDYDGYELALWNIYLRDVYKNYSIFKRQWELMAQYPAIKCIDISLKELGSSFRKDYNGFAVWSNFTNYKAVPNKYFKDASKFPALKPFRYVNITQFPLTYNINTQPGSNKFFAFVNKSNNDTLLTAITNGDIETAVDSPGVMQPVVYKIFNTEGYDRVKIADGYYINTYTDMPIYWAFSEILNSSVVRQDSSFTPPVNTNFTEEYSFPNPFYYNHNYQTGKNIFFTLGNTENENAELNVYTVGMQLVYRGTIKILPFILNSQMKTICWNVKGEDNSELATGVYLYLIKAGDYSKKGKMVIFNDK